MENNNIEESISAPRNHVEKELPKFALSVPNTPEYIVYLESLGYEHRSGSAGPDKKYLTVLPFKKHYWEDCSKQDVSVMVHIKKETRIIHTLKPIL